MSKNAKMCFFEHFFRVRKAPQGTTGKIEKRLRAEGGGLPCIASLVMIITCFRAGQRMTVCHCCLAPCKSVPNYGPLTEPKIYIVKFGRTAIPTLNGRNSETKQDFLNPLVPKFSYDRRLSPTLSWKWPSATLSPSFGLFQSEKKHFFGVF